MPKVSKVTLYITSTYGEDYEIHYNAKKAPKFSIQGIPAEVVEITGCNLSGYDTEENLINTLSKAVQEYKEAKKKERKVILYKASASTELMLKKVGNQSYQGLKEGVSSKINSFGFINEDCVFGLTYSIRIEIDNVNQKQYHLIKDDGSLGFAQSIKKNEQIMEWTQEREDFFANIYNSMNKMVLQMSLFFDQEPESAALFIESKKLLI